MRIVYVLLLISILLANLTQQKWKWSNKITKVVNNIGKKAENSAVIAGIAAATAALLGDGNTTEEEKLEQIEDILMFYDELEKSEQ